MNYKHYFPTYRRRYLFLFNALQRLTIEYGSFKKILNLGAGEGDLNQLIQNYCDNIYACDVNKKDVEYGKSCNPSVIYSVQDAADLNYENEFFDIVICMEVLEHVKNIDKVLIEIERVMKPNGHTIITFPSNNFPVTYDPINFIMKKNKFKFPIGAFAFGHSQLIDDKIFENKVAALKLNVIVHKLLSYYLTGLIEMYWVGIGQKLFKSNSNNVELNKSYKSNLILRPQQSVVGKTPISDIVIKIDDALFEGISFRSIGSGYLIQKPKIKN